MFKDSRSSSHNALDQWSWDSKINWRAFDIKIDGGAIIFPWLRYAWCRWLRLHWKRSSSMCAFSSSKVSRSNVLQKDDRFLRRKEIAYMICEHFRATGAHEAVQGLSDLFNIRSQNDDVQDFDVRWDQALLSASDVLSDVILEGLYESKLQDSVQLQTVLALYEHETIEPDEFGINFWRNETWWHQKYHETGRRSETRTADNNTDSKFYQESWYLESHASYWRSLFSKLYDCYRGIACRKIPRPRWLSVLESLLLRLEHVRKRI